MNETDESFLELKRIDVKNWITLSSITLGATITILGLIWQNPPSTGIYTATLVFMLSFILFMNSITASSRSNYEIKKDTPNVEMIKDLVKYSEHCFGLGLTAIIIGISILSYKYMLVFIGTTIFALLLPVMFITSALILMSIYTSITNNGKQRKFKVKFKKQIWAILEVSATICIGLDYFGFITIL